MCLGLVGIFSGLREELRKLFFNLTKTDTQKSQKWCHVKLCVYSLWLCFVHLFTSYASRDALRLKRLQLCTGKNCDQKLRAEQQH